MDIFTQNAGRYTSPGYSEAQARLDFIDKFWIALGWDVGHETQTDPYKQDVKVERGVAVSEMRKRADYVARHELPWEKRRSRFRNPNGVVPVRLFRINRSLWISGTTPVGVGSFSSTPTQGSSCLATLGFAAQSQD